MPLFAFGERRPELRGDHHFIAHDATLVGSIVLENNVNVWFQTVIRADNDQVTIGEDCNIQDGSVLHVDPGYPMSLARRVTIGHKVMLHGCSIGDGSLIGMGVGSGSNWWCRCWGRRTRSIDIRGVPPEQNCMSATTTPAGVW